MEKVIPQWEKDPAIKAVVLRGAGDRAFCAGGDVTGLYREMRDNPVGHAAARLLPRRVYRQPPHLSLRQAVDLADRRHRHGRRRRPVGARLALGREREVPVRHAGDHHRALPRCRRRLFPDPAAGRARHLPGADQPSPEGGRRAVGRHRRCLCAECEHERPAGGAGRRRSLGARRQPQGRCGDRPLRRRCGHADAAGDDARHRSLLLGRVGAGDRGQAEEAGRRVGAEAARRPAEALAARRWRSRWSSSGAAPTARSRIR